MPIRRFGNEHRTAKPQISVGRPFAFGENWADYAKSIGDAQIAEAETGLSRLLGSLDLRGKRFLDIGCGSGIHSLAALNLGASEVLAVDLDPQSVATAQSLLGRLAQGARYEVAQISVFDLDPSRFGTFDVVYSWGVLHHTGELHRAMHKAAAMVADRGMFLFALYRRTWACPFWKWEKGWYSRAAAGRQQTALKIYVFLFRIGLWATGRSLKRYMARYKAHRGMDYYHDVHDWLGGYPYESIFPDEVDALMKTTGFSQVRSFPISRRRKPVKPFGSGCDEYVYRRD
jgi:2-polyprenyl-6-hydroxyphenyl methylase/3-demethylubiquinone-9 3-methyltransferase